MKYKNLLITICGIVGVALLINQFRTAQAAPQPEIQKNAEPVLTQSLPEAETDNAVNLVLQTIEKSSALTSKWIKALPGSGEWLYISSVYETSQQDLGVDPETGLPIPNKSLWESWFLLNNKGEQVTALIKRTDLENSQNVVYVAWQNDTLYRLPSGVSESTNQPNDGWKTFRPILDHDCNKRLPDFTNAKPGGGVSKKLETQVEKNSDGSDQWMVTMSTQHPAISNISGFAGTFIGQEFICSRNNETGAISKTTEFLIEKSGEKILISENYDYVVMWVPTPPEEMLNMLVELLQINSKP